MSPAHFEAVPNISEGRDPQILEQCAQAIARHANLKHQTSDPTHHRSVYTYFGDADAIFAASLALARVAVAAIDLRRHQGAHPRMGALDVMPIVPLGCTTMAQAVELAHRIGRALWAELGLPVFYYGEAALRPDRRLLAHVRQGEYEGLHKRGNDPHARPDVGDVPLHEQAGAVAVGARQPLVAFNVELASDNIRLARRIAALLRERDGGLRTLRALGIALGPGSVQVSCNITNYSATPISRITELVKTLAYPAGVQVRSCELIGLIPRQALEEAVEKMLHLQPIE